jgi:hypothetical protein
MVEKKYGHMLRYLGGRNKMIESLSGWQLVTVLMGVLFFFFMITYGWIVAIAWAAALNTKWGRKRGETK